MDTDSRSCDIISIMPRQARVYQRSICYHVMNRGVNCNAIFSDDRDRVLFLDLIRRYKESCKARVYHWVLMGNHYHLLIEIAFEHLRSFVGGVQQSYAQLYHKAHGTSGTFWQGRFKSKPVEVGAYLVSCGRYIERNPVRANMLQSAWDYRWSSANHYVTGRDDGITNDNPYVGEFTKRARAQYAEALTECEDEILCGQQADKPVIGSAPFRKALKIEHGHYRWKKGSHGTKRA